MKLSAALEYEKLRDENSRNIMYLNKDGKFYHLYEWSAWLMKTVACTEEFQRERGDAKILAANRYNSKTGEYVMAGFPLESVSKYIPQYIDVDSKEDGDMAISVLLPEDLDVLSNDELEKLFLDWKQEQPIKENKSKSNQQVKSGSMQTPMLAKSGLFQIIAEVISYPVECKTPTDNIEFISNLKRKAVALL